MRRSPEWSLHWQSITACRKCLVVGVIKAVLIAAAKGSFAGLLGIAATVALDLASDVFKMIPLLIILGMALSGLAADLYHRWDDRKDDAYFGCWGGGKACRPGQDKGLDNLPEIYN